MGTCCTKDPRGTAVDRKEENLDNQLVSEQHAKPEILTPVEDTEDDVTFKSNAQSIKSNKQEIIVSPTLRDIFYIGNRRQTRSLQIPKRER